MRVPFRHLAGGTGKTLENPGWLAAGIEPATSRILSQRSTIEPHPLGNKVENYMKFFLSFLTIVIPPVSHARWPLMGPISPHIANAGTKAARLSPRRTMWDNIDYQYHEFTNFLKL